MRAWHWARRIERGHPLRRFAPSPSLASPEGDDALAAGRPLLGVTPMGRARFKRPLQCIESFL
ncbi:hypothetical protein FZC30_00260 [Comamonas thiooxydans]|nr:hypothetical protein FZC30_00260 [Comamonas thiooxydans]